MASNKNKVKMGYSSHKKSNIENNGVEIPQIADVAELEVTNGHGSTTGLMNQVESMLSRLKSEMESTDSIRIYDSGNEVESFQPSELQEATTNTIGMKVKSVRAELERRQSILQAQVIEAENRAQEAEELYKLTEEKYEEVNTRCIQVEQNLLDLDSKYTQLKSAAQAEEMRRLEAEHSGKETHTELKKAEEHLAEIDVELRKENELRTVAEDSLHAAEMKLVSLTTSLSNAEMKLEAFESKSEAIATALSELERKREDAERKAESASTSQDELKALLDLSETDVRKYKQDIDEAYRNIDQMEDTIAAAEHAIVETQRLYDETLRKYEVTSHKLQDFESRVKVDRNDSLKMELLLQEAQNIAATASERFKAAEALLRKETELRFAAERKFKALENELSSYLDIDLNTGSLPPLSEITNPTSRNEDNYSGIAPDIYEAQLHEKQALIETEKDGRRLAEERSLLLEDELRKLDERHRNAEAELKKVVLKQEMQLRNIKEHTNTLRSVPGAQGTTNLKNPRSTSIVAASAYKIKLMYIGYGGGLMLLFVTLLWLIYKISQMNVR